MFNYRIYKSPKHRVFPEKDKCELHNYDNESSMQKSPNRTLQEKELEGNFEAQLSEIINDVLENPWIGFEPSPLKASIIPSTCSQLPIENTESTLDTKTGKPENLILARLRKGKKLIAECQTPSQVGNKILSFSDFIKEKPIKVKKADGTVKSPRKVLPAQSPKMKKGTKLVEPSAKQTQFKMKAFKVSLHRADKSYFGGLRIYFISHFVDGWAQ